MCNIPVPLLTRAILYYFKPLPQVGSPTHCTMGQKLAVTAAVDVNWEAGFTSAAARTLTVAKGETIRFRWTELHSSAPLPLSRRRPTSAAAILRACACQRHPTGCPGPSR